MGLYELDIELQLCDCSAISYCGDHFPDPEVTPYVPTELQKVTLTQPRSALLR